MQFQDDTDQTKLTIQQTGVPTQFYDNTMVSQRDRSRSCVKSGSSSRSRKDGNVSTSKVSNPRLVMERDSFSDDQQ